MSIVVFLGPTLPIGEARREVDAEFLPPVAQGDLYRAARKRPRAIAIVDGYFDRIPSVWHKEILWALSQGIYVFGAASLGALRATELAAFGMIGVGHVFKAFHDGVLEDDDEVAIVHATAEDGYRPLSTAMVDIRATIQAARQRCLLNEHQATQLLDLAKALPYPERSYKRVLSEASATDSSGLEAFKKWLVSHRVERKRDDALMLLRLLQSFADDAPPYRAKFAFHHTDAWEDARNRVDSALISPSNLQRDSSLLNELYLNGMWPRVRDGALARALILRGPGAQYLASMDPLKAEQDFRLAHDLLERDAYSKWRTTQGLSDAQMRQFFIEEAVVTAVTLAWQSETHAELPNYLRHTGELSAVAARAKRKDALPLGSLVDLRIDQATLFEWYFEKRRGIPVPASLSRYAVRAGFEDLAAFRRAVLAEFRASHGAGNVVETTSG